MTTTYQASSLTEITRSLHLAKTAVRDARSAVLRSGSTAAEVIAHAHSFAGAPDGIANNEGGLMLDAAQNTADLLAQLETQINKAVGFTRRAVAAIDESDAQRKTARAKLGS